jgi:hypothetical protein
MYRFDFRPLPFNEAYLNLIYLYLSNVDNRDKCLYAYWHYSESHGTVLSLSLMYRFAVRPCPLNDAYLSLIGLFSGK